MREIKAVWVRWAAEPIVIEEQTKAGPDLIDIRRVQAMDITPRRRETRKRAPSEKEINRGAWAAAAIMAGGMLALLAMWLTVGYAI